MLADLIQIAILLVALAALILSLLHREKVEGFQRENQGVDRYLELRIDGIEKRIDKLEE
jgi:hypothetical protein